MTWPLIIGSVAAAVFVAITAAIGGYNRGYMHGWTDCVDHVLDQEGNADG